jgi:hypothetical protein
MALVNTVINILLPKTAANFMTSRVTIGLSRWSPPNGVNHHGVFQGPAVNNDLVASTEPFDS